MQINKEIKAHLMHAAAMTLKIIADRYSNNQRISKQEENRLLNRARLYLEEVSQLVVNKGRPIGSKNSKGI